LTVRAKPPTYAWSGRHDDARFVADAELRPSEIQDLADVIGEIAKAAVGQDLRFCLHVELGGSTPPPEDVVGKVNEILGQVSEDLRLKPSM
jgi:hypothetical protein